MYIDLGAILFGPESSRKSIGKHIFCPNRSSPGQLGEIVGKGLHRKYGKYACPWGKSAAQDLLATEASVNTVSWRIPLTGTQELSKGALYLFDRSNRPSSKRAGSRLVWVFSATRPGKPPEGFRDFLPAPKWGGGDSRLRARDDSWPRAAFRAKNLGNV